MDAEDICVQQLRNQIGQWVYPVHRLDRKTAGVLLFALNKETQEEVNQLFRSQEVYKYYLAIVRGWTDEFGRIDYPLKDEKGLSKESITDYIRLIKSEMNWSSGDHKTSRYSVLGLTPKTGRMHQIRRHLAHLFHPIIGDRPHGCNKQNRMFKANWNMTTMMLNAVQLKLTFRGEKLVINAPKSEEFKRCLSLLSLN